MTKHELRPLLILPSALLALAAAGCGEDVVRQLEEAGGSVAAAAKVPKAPAQPASLVPPAPWRYVALVNKLAAEPCPNTQAPNWQVRPLFRQGATQALAEGPLPAPLERFCEYTWTLAPQQPPAPPDFAPAVLPKIVRIDPDRDLVIPQAPSLAPTKDPGAIPATVPAQSIVGPARYLGGETTLRDALALAHRTHVGALPAAGAPVKEPDGAPVIAVVDSVGFDDGEAGYARVAARLQHGLAMAGFVRDARCPDADAACRGRLFHAQAFPYSAESPMVAPSGGPLGSLGSLARAIGESVVRWRRMPAPRGPLVVNLSLGWDPALADLAVAPADHLGLLKGQTNSVPATVQAVHAGLVWAACNQALSVAAAGNNAGEPCAGRGPLAPAAWERLPAPDFAACKTLFGADAVVAPAGAEIPGALIYAAGGLTHGDAPLPNARAESLPVRALPAFEAVSSSVRGRTDGWTGSSVAAATLSGIAARAWSVGQARTPHALMRALDGSGASIGVNASLRRDGLPVAPVRRLTAHGAFAASCSDAGLAGAACPNPYAAPPAGGVSQQVAAALGLQGSSAVLGAPLLRPAKTLACADGAARCGGGTVVHRCGVAGTTPAPESVALTAEPWTRPQPDTPICPVCPIQGPTLYISPNPTTTTTASLTLVDPALRFRQADGSWVVAQLADIAVSDATVRVDLSGYRVALGGAVMTLPDLLRAQNVSSGELAFTVPDASGRPSAMVSAVSVYP